MEDNDKADISRSEILNQTDSDQFNRIQDDSVERRGFVKGAIASVTSAVGLSASTGGAAAESGGFFTGIKKRKAIRPYKSVAAVENVFTAHEDLLADIAAETSLSSGSVNAFNVNDLTAPGTGEKGGVTFTTKKIEGEHVAEIRLMKEVEEGHLTVAVLPQIDKRYALLNPRNADEPITFEDIDTQDLCGGCPNNKCCESNTYCCGSDCPSCSCYYCTEHVCKCCQCGWNCAGQCY